ncbi:Tripartite-type tricarboxylate transporter, receptor component TctC [Modicisalibacter ilicicola DSM 19980]|uniref:Tripartite-type tricarboxylate transporter, receptor component TctC n=1 Tax=Modicisalibacter ilicicola DSM 19980 TaxID=1121942 RepID=A0A1M4TIZ3_9GAMM|nr:tripartite tricarboxylate transporter substrate binding protein [Halomonas ilicicola]SHE44294.1 Tripartite-type tricarboxylate transporter, receptor component TctC [Halomonas ilicicola DSM 19980]
MRHTNSNKTFRLGTLFTAVLTSVALSGPVAAQSAEDYPSRNVQYIIPFGPGGESDISARLQQQYFQDITDQQLIIQYMAGGGGAVGWSQLNEMEADGHTIMGTNLPHIVLKPMGKDPGFKTEDLKNFYFFHYSPDALIVANDSPYETLEDFVAAAKQSPGAVTLSGSGTQSANDIANQRFQSLADVKTTYIPFKGTGAAVAALLGGQVQAEWGYTTVAANHSDKVRMLAVAADERHPQFPDVPTFQELGYDMTGGAYRGMAVPKDTPEDVTRKLSDIFGQINQNAEFRKKMQDLGFVLIDVPYAEVDEFMAERREEYEEVAREMGIIE